ncbi:MAG: hypothetical protein ACW964_04000, partial [Candidatus Hodarchaeales archaeon]
MDNIPNSLKIIFHDFFKEFEQVLKEIITSSIVLSLIGPIIDLTISFSDIENSEEVRSFISNLELPESEINSLNGLFDNPFQTSFSYGHQDKEFVFIQLD